MEKKLQSFPSVKKMFAGTLFLASVSMAYANSSDIGFPMPDSDLIVASPQQSKVTISGKVSDATGPIIGASVVEKGTTNGTVTDLDGNFSLNVSANSTLVVSYIGYKDQEIKVGNQRTFNIQLSEDTQKLDEVVVVGYGTQKKVNLTGSISTLDTKDIEARPVTNVSQALAGMAAGVTVTSSSNQPGNDNADIKVRGQGTLNTSSPLIIVDGVEAGINTVNPQDIESMTVLKDAASAAIYGSRAANGVILITTKKGKEGTMKVDYNGYVSFASIRKTLTPVSDYATYMEYINEGMVNAGKATRFSQEKIDEWRADAGRNPLFYPNTDWVDATFQNSTATNHVVSMSGGTDKIRFYGSFGYSDTPGVMPNAGFTKYQARVNLDADIKPWLNVGMQVSGYVSDMEPGGKYTSSGTAVDDTFTYAAATTPGMVWIAPDGRVGGIANPEDDSQSMVNNPYNRALSKDGNIRKNNINARFFGTIKPFKGFSLTASYSYQLTDEHRSFKPRWVDQWNFQTETILRTNRTTAEQTSLSNYNGKTERYFNDVVARYNHKFFNDQLDFTVMAGASQEMYRSYSFNASRKGLLDLSLNTLSAATGESSASGSYTDWVMHSYFGRINLGWADKYLAEFNLRADGSSRFQKNKRWGYFPSGSVAWRIDQESFMEDLKEKGLSSLKLRASYGELGNNSVGNYDSQSTYALSNYTFGNALATGMAITAIPNTELTWESTAVTDIGIDFGFFDNRLTGTIDYFHKKTKDILISLPYPAVHGTSSIPKENSATVVNKGMEFTFGWNDKINDFQYGATLNFSFIKNNVEKFKGKDKGGQSLSGANLIWEGHSINSQYLLRVDRIIQTDADLALVQEMIDNAPIDEATGKKKDPFAAFGKPAKGDLLYKDINKDGVINNNDKEIVSDGPNPKFQFGLNLNAAWKGIDFSMLIQGSFGAKVYWQGAQFNTPTVRYGYQINQEVAEGAWREGRTDATYPRLLEYSKTINTQTSDFYLEDKSFVKIRNIQLGYTLPKAWTNICHLERVRIYGSLENFFTFTDYKGWDPEVSGLGYPSMKQAVVGLNVTF